jgi:hypothetical protein
MIKLHKENNFPAKLYKYGCKIEYLKEILLDNRIYCSSPFDFNDPFEFRPRLDCGNTRQELEGTIKTLGDMLRKKYKALDENSIRAEAERIIKKIQQSPDPMNDYTQLLSRAGVYCLSAKKDNLLMWAHYGNKHKGFCLEFSTEPKGSFFDNAEKVEYKSNYPVVRIFVADNLEWGKESILTKSVDWTYEEEWRLTSKFPGHLDFPPETLAGLILGCKMIDEDRQQILAWNAVRKPSIKIYQASMHEREFKLQINDL